jgi:hypothetical protein
MRSVVAGPRLAAPQAVSGPDLFEIDFRLSDFVRSGP